MTMAVHVSKLF